MPIIKKTLGSSSLAFAPGIIRWARAGYLGLTNGENEEVQRLVNILKSWDLPDSEALYVLQCDEKALSFDEKAGTVSFNPKAIEPKTIWNSDGTDGPCLICPPPLIDLACTD